MAPLKPGPKPIHYDAMGNMVDESGKPYKKMYKQYILVRTDKKYQRGKIIAHVSHNAVINFKKQMYYEDPGDRHFLWYYRDNTTTVVLNGRSLKNIQAIIIKAKSKEIPTSFIEDIKLKEKICAVIGPVTDEEAEELGLKKLKLY